MAIFSPFDVVEFNSETEEEINEEEFDILEEMLLKQLEKSMNDLRKYESIDNIELKIHPFMSDLRQLVRGTDYDINESLCNEINNLINKKLSNCNNAVVCRDEYKISTILRYATETREILKKIDQKQKRRTA